MGSHSQGIRWLRRSVGQGIRILLGAAVIVAASAVAWKLITLPPARSKPTRPKNDERNGPGYLIVAAQAVEVEVVADNGRRTGTASATSVAGADSATKIPDSEATVDCGGYGRLRESNTACSASITIHSPAFGSYRIVISSPDSVRGEAVTVGYGGLTFGRSGGFSVKVVVGPRRPVEFVINVASEGASLRSEPRMIPP